MTSVNLSSIFESSQFWDIAVETFERQSPEYVKELEEQIFSIHRTGGKKSQYDFDEIREMNTGNNESRKVVSSDSKDVFNLDTLSHMQKLKDKFFK